MRKNYVCTKCGSADILVPKWVNPNNNNIDSWVGDGMDFECFCRKCAQISTWEETTPHRFLKIGQKVFCADECYDFYYVINIGGEKEDRYIDDDTIVYLRNDSGSENECFGDNIYIIDEKMSEKIGEIVCYEHKVRDYDYFMPSSDENYYAGELTKFSRD